MTCTVYYNILTVYDNFVTYC